MIHVSSYLKIIKIKHRFIKILKSILKKNKFEFILLAECILNYTDTKWEIKTIVS